MAGAAIAACLQVWRRFAGKARHIGRAVLFWVGTIEDCSKMAVLGIGIIPKLPHFTLTLPYR